MLLGFFSGRSGSCRYQFKSAQRHEIIEYFLANPSTLFLVRKWSFCNCDITRNLILALTALHHIARFFLLVIAHITFSCLNWFKFTGRGIFIPQCTDTITFFLPSSVTSPTSVYTTSCCFHFEQPPCLLPTRLVISCSFLNASFHLWWAVDASSLSLVVTFPNDHLSHAYPHIWKEQKQNNFQVILEVFRAMPYRSLDKLMQCQCRSFSCWWIFLVFPGCLEGSDVFCFKERSSF